MVKWAVAISVLACSGAQAYVDLGVRCISRSPLYWRYNVQYDGNGIPSLASTHGGKDPILDQHWPNPGEAVTFTAQIRNHGTTAATNFAYRWYIDDVAQTPQNQVYLGDVAPGMTVTVTLQWTWPPNLDDHKVRIQVDPDHQIGDLYIQNNTYADYTNGLSFCIWIEQGLYDRFNARINGFGTKSFEDWLRWQFDAMRLDFAHSIYQLVAPNGITERIRVEEINVVPFDPNNLNNWQAYMDADPHVLLNDGRWQFTTYGSTLEQKQLDWDTYVNAIINSIDWGLVHELSHQLGAIDEYRMNLDPSWNHIMRLDGTQLGSGHGFHAAGLMGGGYVWPGFDGSYYDSHTAGFFQRNLHKRRGYYGEFMYDVPLSNTIQLYDINGDPLTDAQISIYQKNENNEQITNVPVITGMSDWNGRMALPNRSTPTTTTATGHTLRANPFGKINVVGANALMMIKIVKDGQEDYRWLEIIQPNLAYWSGQTDAATYTFLTSIFPPPDGATLGIVDVALGKPATASSDAQHAANANNGDTTDPTRTWYPLGLANQWWQVDLQKNYWLYKAIIFSYAGNTHDWFSQFHLEVSTTGKFAGEQTIVPLETDWDLTRQAGDFELQWLTGLGNRCEYSFTPVRGRYARIVSDVDQNWVQLQEAQLFALENFPQGDVNGDGCVDLLDMNLIFLHFGETGSGLPEDLDHDGVVTLQDLNIVFINFGVGC